LTFSAGVFLLKKNPMLLRYDSHISLKVLLSARKIRKRLNRKKTTRKALGGDIFGEREKKGQDDGGGSWT
jgi:hypothetical protein